MANVTTQGQPSSWPDIQTNVEPQNDGASLPDVTERLRQRLRDLWSAPMRDLPAIDEVMAQLDAVHAQFKSQHGTDDHQRY
jgi:hypothetical protein